MAIKLKVNAQSEAQEKQEEMPVQKIEFELKLKQFKEGDVVLQAIDESGKKIEKGNILVVDSDGFIVLLAGVNPGLGFQLDEEGRVRLHKQEGGFGLSSFIKRMLED